MKKFTAILLLLTLCVFAFASCTEEKGGESAEPSSVSTVSESGADVSEPSEEVSSADASEESAPTSSEDVSDDKVIRVGGLKGPTTMGLVKLMEDASTGKAKLNYEFKVEAMPDMITPPLLKGELDMAAVPANLAAVLNNKTDGKIKVVAINTLGVLYIVQKNETIESLADLKGKTVYATGKGTTPEYALFYLLRQAGLDPEKDLTVEWKSEPTEVVALLKNADSGVAMLPQPFVTVAQTQVEGLKTAIDLNDEWNKLGNSSMMVTGVLAARADFLEENKALVDEFLQEYKASADYINANPGEAAPWVEQRIGVKAPIAEKAVPYCNIKVITGAEMKEALSGFLKVMFDQNAKSVGGKLPADDFYYGAQ